MKKFFCLLLMLIASSLLLESSQPIKLLIDKYSKEGLTSKYYAFYLIEENECTPCCINSVNLTINALNNSINDSIIQIGIFKSENKKNRTISMQIKSDKNYFNNEKYFYNYYDSSNFDFPTLLITNNKGDILFIQDKLNNNPINQNIILDELRVNNFHFISLKENIKIPLKEGDTPVNTVFSQRTVNDSIFVFLDPMFNYLQFYNYNNGKFVKYEFLPEDLKFLFYDSTKYNILIWRVADTMNAVFNFREIIKCSDNLKLYKCLILDGYSYEKLSNGRDDYVLHHSFAILKEENHTTNLIKISKPDSFISNVNFIQINKNFIALLDVDWSLPDTNKTIYTKELPILALYDSNFNFIKYLLRYKDLIREGDMLTNNFINFFTASENGSSYLLTKEYSKFISVSEDTAFLITPYKTLKNWIEDKDTSLFFEALLADKDKIVCLLSNSITNSLIFDIYDSSGRFINEINIVNQNLNYKQLTPLAIKDNTIILLIQDEEENWFINKYIFE